MSEWISVEDKLPDGIGFQLVIMRGDIYIGWLAVNGKWYDQDDPYMKRALKVIHWMPLPEPPNDDNGVDYSERRGVHGTL